jgi:hypothetical protein
MNEAPAPCASSLPPFGGSALWQAADVLLKELYGVAFDFWAFCEQWQPVLERSATFSASPLHARLTLGESLCERVAATGQAQCCEWDDARMLVGVPLVEHGHLHLVAIGELAALSPDLLRETASKFAQRWAEREAIEHARDVQWRRALAAAQQ